MTDAAGGTGEQQRMLARLRSRWPGRIVIQGAGLASFCFLATAVLGQVISTDRGRLSQWIQGTEPAKEIKEDSDGT